MIDAEQLEIEQRPSSTLGEDRQQAVFKPDSPQVVVMGRGAGGVREPVLARLDRRLLARLSGVTHGSRSAIIEMALCHMLQDLEAARARGEPPLIVAASDLQDKLEAMLKLDVQEPVLS